jgi:predicted RNase H-like HicB family nuclease
LGKIARDGLIDAGVESDIVRTMKGEFTAIIEVASDGGYWAICPEVPGANGQGESVEEAKTNLREAIRLIFEDRVEDARRGLPEDAIQTVVAV